MVTYQVESMFGLGKELNELLERHKNEVGFDKSQPLNIDTITYKALEEQGFMFVVTARKDGNLIGYAAYFIHHHLHYKHLKMAESDVFFIVPEERKGRVGIELFRKTEQLLKDYGIDYMVNTCKTDHDLSRLFEHLGYKPLERSFIKELK